MNNKYIIWIAVGTGLITALMAWFIFFNDTPSEQAPQSDAVAFRVDYPRVGEDHRFTAASAQEVLAIFEGGDGLVFLGFPECPWCQQLAPIVDEAARAEGLEKIYYLNIRESRAANDGVYQALVDKLRPHLETDEDGEPRIYVPDVTMFRGGEIVGRFQQESAAEGEQVTPDTFWTSERRERATRQLKSIITSSTGVSDGSAE